jgi:hypothetical protein
MADVPDAAPDADQACWCTLLPTVVLVPDAGGACWCRACLQRHIDEQTGAAAP